ncbi:MAG: SAM-dependent methyltransferase, partial [Blastocatellia bacterium]
EALRAAGVPFEVVPGITAAIAAPAYAGIPATHRDFNSSFTFITGHEKEEEYKDPQAASRAAAEGSSDLDWSAIAKLPCVAFYMGVKSLPRICGRLIEMAGRDAIVWVASDHGFGPAHKYCSFNLWLLQEGFLHLKRDARTRIKRALFRLGITPENAFKLIKKLPLGRLRPARGASNEPGTSRLLSTFFLSFNDVDWSRTLAFAKGNYGQIYVNLKGREPRGVVEEKDYDALCRRIVERLSALRDPQTGEPWAGEVFRREEVYDGPRVSDAPDIAFLPRDMRYLPLGNADFTSNKFMVDAFGISGCHRMHGVMIGNAAPVKPAMRLEAARIYDVAPTLLYLMGEPVPADMDGRVLTEIVEEDYLLANPVGYSQADERAQPDEIEYSDAENAEVIESLKNLGYIG